MQVMTNHADKKPTVAANGTDSTVDDWHGQDVDRDIQAADEALAAAGGDQVQAENIFDATRPEHRSDRFNVPASEREGTLTRPNKADHASDAVGDVRHEEAES
jgi:hypothetical protein